MKNASKPKMKIFALQFPNIKQRFLHVYSFSCLLTCKLILECEPGALTQVQRVIYNINADLKISLYERLHIKVIP